MAFAFSLFPCHLKVLMYLPQQEQDFNVFSWFSKFLLRGNRGGRTQSRNIMSCSVSVYFVLPIPREVTQERNQSCCWKSTLKGIFEVACASSPTFRKFRPDWKLNVKVILSLLSTPLPGGGGGGTAIYSGTPLIRPPSGHGNLVVLTGWSY